MSFQIVYRARARYGNRRYFKFWLGCRSMKFPLIDGSVIFRLTGEFKYCKCGSQHAYTPLQLDADQGLVCLITVIAAVGGSGSQVNRTFLF